MAKFLTHNVKSRMTAGERRFYDLLEQYLDDNYLIWYDLPLQGKKRRYPDYLIFHAQYGLLSIEIKDWPMKALKGAYGYDQLVLDFGQGTVNHQNPITQARSSLFPLINKLEKDSYLRQKSGIYQGKLIVPWGYGAVMSNWEYQRISSVFRADLERVLPRKTTFYKEDILEGGLTQAAFLAKLHGLFPYQFDDPITFEQASRIRAHIFPEFIVQADQQIFAEQDPVDVLIPDIVQIMDNEQESAARRLGEGHRVVHGCAGSGKTLLLIYRARKLAQANPEKPILVLCYNKPLAAYLRSQLPHNQVQVYHYHGWCMAMRDQYKIRIPHSDNYPEQLAQTISDASASGKIPSGQYSAVLIDEGHDFAEDWLRAAVRQAEGENGQTQSLLLLYDDAQSIYSNRKNTLGFSLKSVNIAAQGRATVFKKNYRNSQEILQYAADFLAHYVQASDSDDDGIPLIMPESVGRTTGIAPLFQRCENRSAENAAIVAHIQRWQQEGAALGDIAVLCATVSRGKGIISQLRAQQIAIQDLISSDNRLNYRPDKHSVTVCTMHSSKGLEFERVIVSQVDGLEDSEAERDTAARLLYVAMTRAKTHLHLTAVGEHEFSQYL